ncbi:Fe2+-enterobactin ABC transporter substrate-binding protein [Nesterenkonia alba]|uniref:Fe2+-enterobactin ABC transporter substrate-binding protein n=1 Tax=Nesterenkonia alba TaxID=515814 RepID=UPI0003B5C180|nr:Fe2+-enterobactin ABC transporter substrate-binding protein [Nesterenkonia alba]
MAHLARNYALPTLLTAGALLLSACASDDPADADEDTGDTDAAEVTEEEEDDPADGDSAEETEEDSQGQWPRTFDNADGTTTEIPAPPEAVLSTTVSTTGTLLAIDAPVVASGAAGNGEFFQWWADEAEAAGVENAWPAGEVDLEAAYAAEPDLIVVSTTGADSAVDQLEEFQQIAPTIVVDYGAVEWQELAEILAEALGLESQTQELLADYEQDVAEAAESITPPEGEANIISYNGAGEDNPIARATGPHAELLTELGFTMEDPDPEWHTQPQQREDFVWAPHERLADLEAETTFLLDVGDDAVEDFLNDPVLANVPSVQADQVYGLGEGSFRIDYYSAVAIIDRLVDIFGE